jgi:predicted N-acetyltransferase YhbS
VRLRAYGGAVDLRRMQDALSARFPTGYWHPGDLGWTVRNQTHLEASAMCTLAEASDGVLLGWSWVRSSGWLEAIAIGDGDGLHETLVDAALEIAQRFVAHGDVLHQLKAEVADDDVRLAAALESRGFVLDPSEVGEVTQRSLDALPPVPPLPDGFRLCGCDDSLVADRVEAHREAFGSSLMHAAAFRRLRRTWPYRAELDRLVLAPDGRVAASCLAWYDEQSGWGLFEPVGTRPEFRRRGLAKAACIDALHHLRAAGAHSAQVGCESGSAGCATYHACGFHTHAHVHSWRRQP